MAHRQPAADRERCCSRCLGAVLGAAIAVWATEAMRAVPIIGAFPIRFQTSIDGIGLAFAMALGGAVRSDLRHRAGASQLARVDPQAALRAGARTAGRSAMRNTLMAVQVGLALVVLMAAGAVPAKLQRDA